MSSILDIDLDYFNLMETPVQRLAALLEWAGRPVSVVVENHHEALRCWKRCIGNGQIDEPQHILHVDEHHDMMDERSSPNVANFMYHAMQTWPTVRVHWLVEQPIDSPSMWLSDNTWLLLSKRFTWGSRCPRTWPKPELVSVCTSPQFVPVRLRKELMALIRTPMRAEPGAAPDGNSAALHCRR